MASMQTKTVGRGTRPILWALLTLALALCLTAALSQRAEAVESYGLWIGGEEVTSENLDGVGNTGEVPGTWSFTPASGEDPAVLTLENYHYAGLGSVFRDNADRAALYYQGSAALTVELVGDSVLTMSDSEGLKESVGMALYKWYDDEGQPLSVTIRSEDGKGTLSVIGGGVSFDEVGYTCGIYAEFCDLTVSGAAVTATGGASVAYQTSYGAMCNYTNLTVTDAGSLTAVGGAAPYRESFGLYVIKEDGIGSVTVNGGGTLTAVGGAAESHSYGIYGKSSPTVSVSGGELIARGVSATADLGVRAMQNVTLSAADGLTLAAGDDAAGAQTVSAYGNQKYLRVYLSYKLWIGGEEVTSGHLTGTGNDSETPGTWTYTPASGSNPAVLTLNNYHCSSEGYSPNVNDNYGLYYRGNSDLKIALVGENVIDLSRGGEESSAGVGIEKENDYGGSPTVTVTSEAAASLTAAGCDFPDDDAGDSYSYGAKVSNFLLRIDGKAAVTFRGGKASNLSCGASVEDVVVGDNASLTAEGGWAYNGDSFGLVSSGTLGMLGTLTAKGGQYLYSPSEGKKSVGLILSQNDGNGETVISGTLTAVGKTQALDITQRTHAPVIADYLTILAGEDELSARAIETLVSDPTRISYDKEPFVLVSETYCLWIGGEKVTNENLSGVGNDSETPGTWTYTPASNGNPAVLTLDNYHYAGDGVCDAVNSYCAALYYNGPWDLDIELIGVSELTQAGTDGNYSGAVRFWGPGIPEGSSAPTIRIRGEEGKGGELTARGGDASLASSGITGERYDLALSGAAVNAIGGHGGSDSYGVFFQGGELTLSDGTLKAVGGQADGIYSDGVYINNAALSVAGGTLTAEGGQAAERSAGVDCGYSCTVSVSGGELIASGGESGKDSFGVYTDSNSSPNSVSVTGGGLAASGGSTTAIDGKVMAFMNVSLYPGSGVYTWAGEDAMGAKRVASYADEAYAWIAADPGYRLWIDGREVYKKRTEALDDDGNGWSFDPETYTLTLTNYKNGSAAHSGSTQTVGLLYSGKRDLTVELVGSNVVSTLADGLSPALNYGIALLGTEKASLTIQGEGTLRVIAGHASTEEANTAGASVGIYLRNGDLTVSCAGFTAISSDADLSYGVECNGDVTVTGKLQAGGGLMRDGETASSNNINYGVICRGGLTVDKDASLTAVAGPATTLSAGIYIDASETTFLISGGTVRAASGDVSADESASAAVAGDSSSGVGPTFRITSGSFTAVGGKGTMGASGIDWDGPFLFEGGEIFSSGAADGIVLYENAPTLAEGTVIRAGADKESAAVVETFDETRSKPFVSLSFQRSYGLWIGGEEVTSKNLSGEGWSFDPETCTLTLNGYAYSGEGKRFRCEAQPEGQEQKAYTVAAALVYTGAEDLTVSLSGDNRLIQTSGDETPDGSYGIYIGLPDDPFYGRRKDGAPSVTFKGSGTLTAAGGEAAEKGYSCGVWSDGDICFETCTAELTGGAAGLSYGVYTYGSVALSGGDLTVHATQEKFPCCLFAMYDLTVTDAKLTAAVAPNPTDAARVGEYTYGLFCGGKVTFRGASTAVDVNSGDAEIATIGIAVSTRESDASVLTVDGATVTATAGSVLGEDGYADGVAGDGECSFFLSGGSLTASAGRASDWSKGMDFYGDVTVTGGTLKGTGGDSDGESCGLDVRTLTVKGGTVVGIAGEAPDRSYGVDCSPAVITGGTVTGFGGRSDNSAGIFVWADTEGYGPGSDEPMKPSVFGKGVGVSVGADEATAAGISVADYFKLLRDGYTGDKTKLPAFVRFSGGAEVTVTFDANGGKFAGGSATYVKTAPSGTEIYVIAADVEPVRTNYTLSGWAFDAEGKTKAEESYVVTSDVTLYAVWKADGGDYYIDDTRPPAPIVAPTEHGTVTLSPKHPDLGQTVTVTVTPEELWMLGSLTATDSDGKPVTLTKNPDGSYSFVQGSKQITVTAVFIDPLTLYSDLDPDAWYADDVRWALCRGCMEGYGNGLFGPGDAVSRATAVTVLWKLSGRPGVNYAMRFTDVSGDDWFAEAVRWAASVGLAQGYEDGAFRPGQSVTREELAVFFFRYAAIKGVSVSGAEQTALDFSDAEDVSVWAKEAIRWAVREGILNGRGDGVLAPDKTATRAELAAILRRFDKLLTADA